MIVVAALIVAAALVFHGGCVLAAADRAPARPLAAVVDLARRTVNRKPHPGGDDHMETIGL